MIEVDVIKIADRLSREGRTVTFQVHHDNAAAIAVLPLGSQWRMTLTPLDDDGNPQDGVTGLAPREAVGDPCDSDAPPPARRPLLSLPLTQQAALLCNDPVFRRYLSEARHWHCDNEAQAAEGVRVLCKIESRSELSSNHRAAVAFHDLREHYLAWKAVPI